MARNPPRPPIPETDANELLRRHFEARFQPIEADGAGAAALCKENVGSLGQSPEWSGLSASSDNDDDDDDDDDDDNEGCCDAESGDDCDSDEDDADDDDDDDVEMQDEDDITAIEVVDHSAQQTPKQNSTMSKRELKAFMSSRPPDPNSAAAARSNVPSPSSSSSSKALPEDAPSLLAQDLQLRRLLAESHLLAPHHAARKSLSGTASNAAAAAAAAAQEKTFTAGRTRQKATDLRIQALGSKTSILTQRNVPMAIRQGKQATADAREAKRRREARENGIILERGGGGGAVTKRGSRNKERRKGGGGGAQVDRPGIGRFKGAELRISERDVRGIEGSRDTFGRRSRR